MLEGLLDYFEFDDSRLWIIWGIGMIVLLFSLRALHSGGAFSAGNPEFFTIPKLIGMGVMGAIVLIFIAQVFLNKNK